jgi:hypothetical protein
MSQMIYSRWAIPKPLIRCHARQLFMSVYKFPDMQILYDMSFIGGDTCSDPHSTAKVHAHFAR